MSQRNPMNDRYQTDEHRGQTRKSAASAKPKTKAASSVRMQPTVKTKQQKKAEKRVQRAKQAEIDRQYYNPPTAEYKRLRKVWWGLLIGAIVLTYISEYTRVYLSHYNGLDMVIYGVLVILIVLFIPDGLISIPGRIKRRRERRHTAGKEAPAK